MIADFGVLLLLLVVCCLLLLLVARVVFSCLRRHESKMPQKVYPALSGFGLPLQVDGWMDGWMVGWMV